jgi:hypothetical protein
MPELKSLCENSKMKPSAAKAALNFPELRHGWSRALPKNKRSHPDSEAPTL